MDLFPCRAQAAGRTILRVTLGLASFACAAEPADTVVLRVERVDDPVFPREAAEVRIHRGQIIGVEALADNGTGFGVLSPGRLELWAKPGLPTPTDLASLLADGVTSLVVADRPRIASLALRSYVGTGRNRGPRLYVSGPELSRTLPPARTSSLRYRTEIQDAFALGVDFILLDSSVGWDLVCMVIEETKRQRGHSWLLVDSDDWPRVESHRRGNTDRGLSAGGHTSSRGSREDDLRCLPTARWIKSRWRAGDLPRSGAFALQLGAVLGRIQPGYRADLVLTGRGIDTTYLDGVRQDPNAPWLAPVYIAFARAKFDAAYDSLLR